MPSNRKPASSRNGGVVDYFWNLIGGTLVSGMIAGAIYVFIGTIAQFLNNNETYWDLFYLKCYFAAVLFFYLVMPVMLANAVSFIFGSKSKASGGTKNI